MIARGNYFLKNLSIKVSTKSVTNPGCRSGKLDPAAGTCDLPDAHDPTDVDVCNTLPDDKSMACLTTKTDPPGNPDDELPPARDVAMDNAVKGARF